ncbi:MAG: hypothetical protein LUQ40_04730 [Methanomicrobiales archaeon]|nr:hypothetical protein [Methanomicrobiales archaeon]
MIRAAVARGFSGSTPELAIPRLFIQLAGVLGRHSGLSEENVNEYANLLEKEILRVLPRPLDERLLSLVRTQASTFRRGGRPLADANLVMGLHLTAMGEYRQAVPFLEPIVQTEAMAGITLAFCLYTLGTSTSIRPESASMLSHPSYEMPAREALRILAEKQPPLFSIRAPGVWREPELSRIFWFMINFAFKWFPRELYFLLIGLQKAKMENNAVLVEKLVKKGVMQFSDNQQFLQELFLLRMQQGNGPGARDILTQMRSMFPASVEPVYYSLIFALMVRDERFFRENAYQTQAPVPPVIIDLLETAWDGIVQKTPDALTRIREFPNRFPDARFLAPPLLYIAQDLFGDDEKRHKPAEKALFETMDGYAKYLLNMRS